MYDQKMIETNMKVPFYNSYRNHENGQQVLIQILGSIENNLKWKQQIKLVSGSSAFGITFLDLTVQVGPFILFHLSLL